MDIARTALHADGDAAAGAVMLRVATGRLGSRRSSGGAGFRCSKYATTGDYPHLRVWSAGRFQRVNLHSLNQTQSGKSAHPI